MLVTKSGSSVGNIGQGSWHFGEHARYANDEIASIRAGIAAGMNLIDTAEMYGDGGAEFLIGRAIQDLVREEIYLVSKIYPHNANWNSYLYACENSLKRLNTDYLDLYLLHWRGMTPLSEVVACMEDLKSRGLILNWGVSNFDISDMEELFTVKDGENCTVNQVLHHLGSRGIEYSLLPWQQKNNILTMAYSPLAQAGDLRKGLFGNTVLGRIAKSHEATVAQVLLAFLLSKPMVIPIPRTRNSERTRENAEAIEIKLSEEDLAALDREYPPPKKKLQLDIE